MATKEAKEKIKVYLSGGMEVAENRGKRWRDKLKPWLESRGFEVIDPVVMDSKTQYPEKVNKDGNLNDIEKTREVMETTIFRDLELVYESHIVVCFWDKAAANGAGTHGEVTMAKRSGIPVIIVNNMGSCIPAWMIGCSTHILDTFEELKGYLGCIYVQWQLNRRTWRESNGSN